MLISNKLTCSSKLMAWVLLSAIGSAGLPSTNWSPPPNWQKRNKHASRIQSKRSSTTSYICKDNTGKILQLSDCMSSSCCGNFDYSEAIRNVIRKANNISIENDSRDNFIHNGQKCTTKVDFYLIDDIKFITRKIKCITFSYCHRTGDALVDRIARRDYILL